LKGYHPWSILFDVSFRRIEKNKELYNFLSELLGDELTDFLEWAYSEPPTYMRVNTLKIEKEELRRRLERQGFQLHDMEFYDLALRVEGSPQLLGRTLEHFLGYFYVQDAASMVPPLIMDPQPGEMVLDLAAAPGSKATQIAQMMENRGVLVANDNSIKRIKALSSNIDRLGVLNAVITEQDGYKLAGSLAESFDRVLLDVPCSALGTIAKSNEVVRWWTTHRIGNLVRVQRGLILAAYRALRPGGVLVYSTCTLVPEENEGVVDFLLKREESADLLRFDLPGIKFREGLTEWKRNRYDPRIRLTRRIMPYENEMEGFFIARITRKF